MRGGFGKGECAASVDGRGMTREGKRFVPFAATIGLENIGVGGTKRRVYDYDYGCARGRLD